MSRMACLALILLFKSTFSIALSPAECAQESSALDGARQTLQQAKAGYNATHTAGAPPPEQGDPAIASIASNLAQMESSYARDCGSNARSGGGTNRGTGSGINGFVDQLSAEQEKQDALRRSAQEQQDKLDSQQQAQQQTAMQSILSSKPGPGEPGGQDDPWKPSSTNATGSAESSDENYQGRPCRYFTCASARQDGTRTNYYHDGAFVIYGSRAYECSGGAWQLKGPASAWLPAGEKNRAENLEAGCQN